ncbi:hypothetical protein KIN20_030813 [Parelaphostrongylus tenuis]|uniref:Uncharacterized protein n=1 Tax=Parelaphostrongylus tenuis TaxID=148309 RepID=A0AAD5R493_PARTN|nr:hypothetical protein KIN20_030813 [Parelaphostrongylus tenuis]
MTLYNSYSVLEEPVLPALPDYFRGPKLGDTPSVDHVFPPGVTRGRTNCAMVLVQVELASPAQVQDLILFLLSRSYHNFRVTDHKSFVAGNVSTRISSGLSQPSNRPLCHSASAEDVHSAQDAATRSELGDDKRVAEAPSASDGFDQLDLFEQKPTEQDLKACVVMSNATSLLHSEATELMTEVDTIENDSSLDVSSLFRNASTVEGERAISNEEFDSFYSDPFNVSRLRKAVRLMRRGEY